MFAVRLSINASHFSRLINRETFFVYKCLWVCAYACTLMGVQACICILFRGIHIYQKSFMSISRGFFAEFKFDCFLHQSKYLLYKCQILAALRGEINRIFQMISIMFFFLYQKISIWNSNELVYILMCSPEKCNTKHSIEIIVFSLMLNKNVDKVFVNGFQWLSETSILFVLSIWLLIEIDSSDIYVKWEYRFNPTAFTVLLSYVKQQCVVMLY